MSNFRSTFTAARAAGIALPLPISDVLGPASSLPASNFSLGATGAAVTELQQYLIQAASGPAATRLASAGATGYFGVLTRAALAEYQAAHPSGASPAPAPSNPAALTRNLYRGVSGEDVRTLQRLLNAKGYTVALTGPGSPGNETTYFGPATEAAVIKFQIARGLTPAVGYVGPLTRAALAAL